MNTTETLYAAKKIAPPKWLPSSVQYECIMGSQAYGVNEPDSDLDIHGFCTPPKELLFPHQIGGEIEGFGTQGKRFNQFQQHHIQHKNKEYDIHIYSIVRYLHLLMDGNPDKIDSIFVPQHCILKISAVGQMVREKRHMFLSKKCFHTLKGYAYSQLHKCDVKERGTKKIKEFEDKHCIPRTTCLAQIKGEIRAREISTSECFSLSHLMPNTLKEYLELYEDGIRESARFEQVKTLGQDNKFLYHVVRLLSECEQVLEEGDLDLQEKGRREHMKAIRRGEVSKEEVTKWFNEKERSLEALCERSKLRYSVDEVAVKQLLLNCLEHQYGSLSKVIHVAGKHESMINKIKEIINE